MNGKEVRITIYKANFESKFRAGVSSNSARTVMVTNTRPSFPYLKATSAHVAAPSSGKTISARTLMPIWLHCVCLRIRKVSFEPSSWTPSS